MGHVGDFGLLARGFRALAAAVLVVMFASFAVPAQAMAASEPMEDSPPTTAPNGDDLGPERETDSDESAHEEPAHSDEPDDPGTSPSADDRPDDDADEKPTKDERRGKALQGDDAGPAHAIPEPTGNDAVITVEVAGDRSDERSAQGLAGVKLQLYGGNEYGPGSPVSTSWSKCTSDAAGDCTFTIPNTHCTPFLLIKCWTRGENRDRRFWVVQESAPAPFDANQKLVTTAGSSRYAFRTGEHLTNGNVYSSGHSFMNNPAGNNPSDSSGVWQNTRRNPKFQASCAAGLRVALVLDLSGSVGKDQDNLKDSATGMVDALTGTGSSLALYTFASTAPRSSGSDGRNYAPMAIDNGSNATTIKDRINGYGVGGGTNWDRGLYQVASDEHNYDLVVVVTDGMPTYYGDGAKSGEGNGNTTRFIEDEMAIFSANAIKKTGARLLAVGVGDGVKGDPANLAAISGPQKADSPTSINDADYFQAGWSELEDLLNTVATSATCRADIEIAKQQIAYGADKPAPGGAGWTFRLSASGGSIEPSAEVTTGRDSTATSALKFPTPDAKPAHLSLTELLSQAQKSAGWRLKDVSCTINGKKVTVESSDVKVPVTIGDSVRCVVVNEQQLKPGVSIEKRAWDTPNANGLRGAKEIDSGSQVTDGKTITWTYTVTNTGQTPLDTVGVVDDALPAGAVACPKTRLAIGESMTCTASGPITVQP